jgi:hypothetical protein
VLEATILVHLAVAVAVAVGRAAVLCGGGFGIRVGGRVGGRVERRVDDRRRGRADVEAALDREAIVAGPDMLPRNGAVPDRVPAVDEGRLAFGAAREGELALLVVCVAGGRTLGPDAPCVVRRVPGDGPVLARLRVRPAGEVAVEVERVRPLRDLRQDVRP